MLWGLVNTLLIKQVDMEDFSHLRKASEHDGEKDRLLGEGHQTSSTEGKECLDTMKHISTLIADGAITFLK
jgi:hypothetical protein